MISNTCLYFKEVDGKPTCEARKHGKLSCGRCLRYIGSDLPKESVKEMIKIQNKAGR